MSYTKNTWQTGDIVSSEKLNHMEDGIADAQNGYTVETTESIIVPQQSVTTLDQEGVSFGELTGIVSIPTVGGKVKVTFDGVDYDVTATRYEDGVVLGDITDAPDFTHYPFVINLVDYIDAYVGFIGTETAGTYTVKVVKEDKTATVDDDFTTVVKTIDAMGEFHIRFSYDNEQYRYLCDKTFAEMLTAFNNGQKIVAHYKDEPLLCQKLNIDRDYFEFVFVSDISASKIDVDVFGFAIDDTVAVGAGTISLVGAT